MNRRIAPDPGGAMPGGEPRDPSAGSSGPGWVSIGLLLQVWQRLKHEWRGRPRERRARWGRVFGLGFVCAQVVSVLCVWGGRAMEVRAHTWETAILESLDEQALVSFTMAIWMEPFGSAFVLWPLMLFAAGTAAWLYRPFHALSILLGYSSTYLHVFTGWLLWERPRPTQIAEGLGSPGGLHSFPSGHVAQAVFAYGILIYLWMRRTRSRTERAFAIAIYLILVALVSFARLRLGAHWPTDVAAALLVASVWLAAVVASLRAVERVPDAT